MGSEPMKLSGPDLAAGVAEDQLADGVPLLGHAHGEPVILVRRKDEVFAVGAACTHYGASLADGLVVGEQVRCPWHHACFSLRTGAVEGAPALNPIPCFAVAQAKGKIRVGEKVTPKPATPPRTAPSSVVIVGTGAAGHAAAEALRNQGYAGKVTLIGRDPAVPYDRPNLSKDYLAGTAPEEWMSLRPPEFYVEQKITLETSTEVAQLDLAHQSFTLGDGRKISFGAAILAPGADPIRLNVPGGDGAQVHMLRSMDDCRRIIAALPDVSSVALVGAGFIGLEAAASLRARGLQVAVIAPDEVPLGRVFGAEVGAFVRALHEEHGVTFHLGQTVAAVEPGQVRTSEGTVVPADLVLVGIGVRPSVDLARQAGLQVDGGILVDEYLQTSSAGIYAAGDAARYPDPASGERVRVEHWVVAQRMGAHAAANALGKRRPYRQVPFFWTVHYDVTFNYVGHADGSSDIAVDGSLEGRDATVRYRRGGRLAAVLTVGRDRVSLEAERDMAAVIEAAAAD